MGGRGASGSSLAGAKADLDYAQKMYSEAARRLNYTNSSAARTSFEQWGAELNRAREAYDKLEQKRKRRRKNSDVPF